MLVKEMIDVMAACLDGKTIEFKLKKIPGDWEPISQPTWNWDTYDYRVKPEPRVLWIHKTRIPELQITPSDTENYIKVVEVLE